MVGVVRMSGALALLFPEMMELVRVIELLLADVRAMPPPPVPAAAPLAVLPQMVLFWTRSDPVLSARLMPPPEPAAVLLAMVLL